MQDKHLVSLWNRHTLDSTSMHSLCVQAAEDKRLNPLPTAVELERLRTDEVTQRLLMTMAHIDKGKLSHRAFERELVLLHLKCQ